MTHTEAIKQGLEPVYPMTNQWAERIFYDPREGQYYDAFTDLYLWGFDPIDRIVNKFDNRLTKKQ